MRFVPSLVARTLLILTVSALAVSLTACGERDKRIRSLKADIGRDSALKLLGAAGADSTPFIYFSDRYLTQGRQLEVLYYDPQGRKKTGKDSVPGEELTPVVLEGGKVKGWGWTHWDRVAKSLDIIPLAHSKR